MKMDVSALRQQYGQRRSREVLLFNTTASDRMSDAVSIVPVAQGSTSPWQPNNPSPPVGSLKSNPKIFDPWHVHLDLHRRSHLLIQLPPSSLETKTSRCSGSSSEVFSSSRQEGPSPSGSPCSSRDTLSSDPLRADPGSGSSDGFTPGSSEGCREDQVQGSSEDPHHSSSRRSTEVSESDPTSPHQNQEQNQSVETSRSGQLLNSRIRRQLSAGGKDSSSQNHYPFPSRKTPKISEAARRLGLYSSF